MEFEVEHDLKPQGSQAPDRRRPGGRKQDAANFGIAHDAAQPFCEGHRSRYVARIERHDQTVSR